MGETPASGPDLLRKWERKYALTTEYLVKAAYGWLIVQGHRRGLREAADGDGGRGAGSRAAGDDALLPRLRVLERFPDGGALATLPRYDDFKDHAAAVARRGARFVEIAGNRGPILVTALVPSGWTPPVGSASVLFRQDVLTRPGRQRAAVTVPVGALADLLRALEREGHTLEHVYDY